MKRIPEAELMDDVEQAKAYADADLSEAHDSFVTHFRQRFPDIFQEAIFSIPADRRLEPREN